MVRQLFCWFSLLLIGLTSLAGCGDPPLDDTAHIAQLTVKGAVGPATTDYIVNALANAHEQGAQAVIIRLNSRGGLESAGHDIARHLMASPIPVITYVSPDDARVTNAGLWILYASHIAAMAPASSLLLPSPPAARARTADAAIASELAAILSTRYQRNTHWATGVAKGSPGLTAEQALTSNVIDIIAPDLDSLLSQARNVPVRMGTGTSSFTADNLPVKVYSPDLRNRLLAFATHPMSVYLLLLVGIYGLIIESYGRGAMAPGIIGILALLAACYGLQLLPLNGAGLALIVLGALLIGSEALISGFGVMVVSGVVALVIGSYILVDTHVPGLAVEPRLTSVLATLSSLALVGFLVAKGRLYIPYLSPRPNMVGRVAYVAHSEREKQRVRIDGELWSVRTGGARLYTGQRVRITAQRGPILTVEPADDESG